MRICSLLPSGTEIVFALDLGDQLVAVTHECDVPARAGTIPIITRSTFDQATRRSRDIHNHVTEAMHRGSSIYSLDRELLERLDPTLILTQELCEVCAISYEEVVKAVHRLEVTLPGKRTILSLEPHDLAGVLHSIEQVGDAAGVHERAATLAQTLRDRIKHIASMAHAAPIQPRVFAMEWLDPPYTAGHWVPEMIRLAGGRDEMSREGTPSVQVSWEEIARYDPDILVLMPCSFSLERTINEFAALHVPEAWHHLKAVKSARVYAVEGATYFSRSGPRTVDGLQILAEIMHPELFPRTSPPNAWTRVGTG
jgi:iron complex transport system substrate-binding protein